MIAMTAELEESERSGASLETCNIAINAQKGNIKLIAKPVTTKRNGLCEQNEQSKCCAQTVMNGLGEVCMVVKYRNGLSRGKEVNAEREEISGTPSTGWIERKRKNG